MSDQPVDESDSAAGGELTDEAPSVASSTDRDGVASLLDSQADAGDENADVGIYTLDTLEASELRVDLDVVEDEPRLT